MSGDVVAFPVRAEMKAAPTGEPGSHGFQQSPTMLLAKALLYALTPEQRAMARAYLLKTDPQRADPATVAVERIMRQVRQTS